MKWAGMGEFLAMGGYGLYVWGSYAVTAIAIGLEIALLIARHRAARRGAATEIPRAGSSR